MGRRISKEFLHPSILEGVNDKIGNLDSLETNAKGNMVQAINELVEKLDNSAEIESGKELIANAVGEPLTAEESFDEMSNDINSLLSTFKTNMMNNGITVESNDRFKSLIDKIATMVEEGSGKGIQFAMGEQAVEGLNTYDLDFTPNYIFVEVTGSQTVYAWQGNYLVSNLNTASFTYTRSGEVLRNTQISITDISNTSFNIYIHDKERVDFGKWYAIGVGEEDTTLRDSLADILENKGADVTEEDDMASLISKVDNLDVKLPSYASFKVVNGASYTFYEYVDSSYWSTSTSFVTRDEYKWIAPADGPYKTYFAASIQPTSDGYVYGSAYYYTISDSDGNVIKTSGTYGSESTGGNGYVISDVVELSKGQILTFYARTQNSAGPFKCASLTIKAGLELIY